MSSPELFTITHFSVATTRCCYERTEPTPCPLARNRLLTAEEFQRLADVPPEIEWFANLTNLHPPQLQAD